MEINKLIDIWLANRESFNITTRLTNSEFVDKLIDNVRALSNSCKRQKCFDFNGFHGKYVGDNPLFKNKTALVQSDGAFCFVQIDTGPNWMRCSWITFEAKDWKNIKDVENDV